MSVIQLSKPYKRCCLPFEDGRRSSGGKGGYLKFQNYAKDGYRYVYAASLIQKDFIELCEYIEPDAANFQAYSFRIQSLLIRTCIEIEANFKAILRENGYSPAGSYKNWNVRDYWKVEKSHLLSKYQVRIPTWRDTDYAFTPFEAWSNEEFCALWWYQSYNAVKHDRNENFAQASFKALCYSICGLFALLAAQFYDEDFSPRDSGLSVGGGRNDGYSEVAGDFFRVRFPDAQDYGEVYTFERDDLEDTEDFFVSFNYNNL